MIDKSFKPLLITAALLTTGLVGVARAQDAQPAPADPCGLKIEAPWVRATVPGQNGTGAFMQLTARQACQLVAVRSPIAGVAQIHRMAMEGGVMRMREVEGGLPLPAGQTVELAPNGLHLMLMDLKQPVATGASVPITLTVQNPQTGVRGQISIDASVRALGADVGAMAHHGDMAH
ncbi:MAG: copper chaperone PCu(A)C [Burkholderiaceae bacterium]|nr:copper chaperone PCu(A)C [Burkholderiaceae bacterium]